MQRPGSRVDICGVYHSVIDYEAALRTFENWIRLREGAHQVCISNVHTTVMCTQDNELKAIANNAAMVTIDGQPLRWYANLVHQARLEERVCGPELMKRCLEAGLDKGWRHYFLGGKPEVLEGLCRKLKATYPGLKIAGGYSPPFKPLSGAEEAEIAARINASGTDFLWVGLGAPKQEKWIARNLERVNVPVQVGVGAAFDFLSGNIKRAPVFMQQHGLEWLYRLYQDPRLYKRYLSTNPVFLYMLARDYLKHAWSGALTKPG